MSQNGALFILAQEDCMKLVIEARLIDDVSESPPVRVGRALLK